MAVESGRYTPGDPPDPKDPEAVVKKVYDELNAVSQVLGTLVEGRNSVLYAAPTKPRVGQIVYADGATWNPGNGAGYYYYDGSAWVWMGSQGLQWKVDTFSGNGTWTKPANVAFVIVELQAAGGGGGGRRTGAAFWPGGGGAGEFARRYVPVTGNVTVAVGVAGIKGTSTAGAGNTDGSDGGDATFGSITVKGGKGGKLSSAVANGGGGAAGGAFGPAAPALGVTGVDAVEKFDATSGATGCGGGTAALRGGRCSYNLGGVVGTNTAGAGGASYTSPGGSGATTAASAAKPGPGAGGGAAEDLTFIAADGGDGYVRVYYLGS